MFWLFAWIMPAVVLSLLHLLNWAKGKDITTGEAKLILLFVVFGPFVSLLDPGVYDTHISTVILIHGRRKNMSGFSVKDALPGSRLNDNRNTVDRIVMLLEKKKGICPCSILEDADHQCPCRDYRQSLVCKCGLYVKD